MQYPDHSDSQEVLTNFITIRRLMATHMRRAKKPLLPQSQIELLFTSFHNPEASLKEVAAIMHLTPGAVTQLVETLERQKYLQRKASSTDRRSFQLALTPKGHKVITNIKTYYREIFQEMTSALTAEELRELTTIQTKMIAALKEIKS